MVACAPSASGNKSEKKYEKKKTPRTRFKHGGGGGGVLTADGPSVNSTFSRRRLYDEILAVGRGQTTLFCHPANPSVRVPCPDTGLARRTGAPGNTETPANLIPEKDNWMEII